MRVLLDEQMPNALASELAGHQVRTVGQMGWKGLDNGALLSTAAPDFDAVISMDKNMSVELDISQYRIGLVLIRAVSNRIEALRPLVPQIMDALAKVRPGQLRRVGA